MDAPKTQIKVSVVGDGYIGKTCLLLVYKDKEFCELPATVCDLFTVDMTRDDKNYTVTLADIVGQENYDRFHAVMLAEADVFIVCYAVDQRASFANVQLKWSKKIKEVSPQARIILVGTKLDTRPGKFSHSKFVSSKEGYKMSKRINAVSFVECSAKAMKNVQLVFERALDAALARETKKTCNVL